MSIAVSHIGIAVRDLDSAVKDYKMLLSCERVEREKVQSEGVEVALFQLENSEIELLAPLTKDSSIAKFLESRGEGIHHIALRVGDVKTALEKAKANGFRILDEEPRRAARGAKAGFVHPKSTHGVLLEFYDR